MGTPGNFSVDIGTSAPRPRLLDLFCGAGGAALGYLSAGFDVIGVDLTPQPDYPARFILGDAVAYLREHGHEFDAIHASPPCQTHSTVTPLSHKKTVHTDLIPPVRDLLLRLTVPWVIENVIGSPLRRDLVLCGTQFGLNSYRHRVFESNIALTSPEHHKHVEPVWYPYDKRRATYGLPYRQGWMIPVHGNNNAPPAYQFAAMGVASGQMSRKGLIQAIPPKFAEYIGIQIIKHLAVAA